MTTRFPFLTVLPLLLGSFCLCLPCDMAFAEPNANDFESLSKMRAALLDPQTYKGDTVNDFIKIYDPQGPGARVGKGMIRNFTQHRLSSPEAYVFSGRKPSIPFFVNPGKGDVFLIRSAERGAKGAVGVFTYKIDGTNFRLAFCYSIPYDRNLYENWFKMQIINDTTPTDKALYEDMYYNYHKLTLGDIAKAKDGAHTWSNGFKMTAAMTTERHADIDMMFQPLE